MPLFGHLFQWGGVGVQVARTLWVKTPGLLLDLPVVKVLKLFLLHH